MRVQHEAPQQSRVANEAFEAVEAGMFKPAQNCGPRTGVLLLLLTRTRQRFPMSRGLCVMLDVIAVVELALPLPRQLPEHQLPRCRRNCPYSCLRRYFGMKMT